MAGSYIEPSCAVYVSRPCLPDEESFELEFEPSLNVLQDNMIHGMQNNHSDDNSRRPDFGKIF